MKLSILLFCFAFAKIQGQGLYNEFGQNRIQTKQVQWKTLKQDNIEIIYYEPNEALANRCLEICLETLPKMEDYMRYKLGSAMQIVVFENLPDYRHSNMGYQNPEFSAGGYSFVPRDISSVYFTGDYVFLKKQLTRSIVDIIMNGMMYGGTIRERIQKVRSYEMPKWFTHGLANYLSQEWDAHWENRMRDAIATNVFRNFNTISDEHMELAGISIWKFLVDNYGPESVSTLLFISRYTNRIDDALIFHTKKNTREILNEWREHYENKYVDDMKLTLPKGKANVPKRIAQKNNVTFALSPDGKKVALVSNDMGRYEIWTFDLNSGNTHRIYAGGAKMLNQIPDYNFPMVQWKLNNTIAILTYEANSYTILEYSETGSEKKRLKLGEFSSISGFNYNKEGDRIAFAGVRKNAQDIFIMKLPNRELTQVTNDLFTDKNPVFAGNGSDLLFVSNRNSDTAYNSYLSEIQNLFRYKVGNTEQLTTYQRPVNLGYPFAYAEKDIVGYLSDESGLSNAYALDAKKGENPRAQTNYRRSILAQQISEGGTIAEMLRYNGYHTIFTSDIPVDPITESVEVSVLPWKQRHKPLDSIFKYQKTTISQMISVARDSLNTEIVDTLRKNYRFLTGFPKIDYPVEGENLNSFYSRGRQKLPFINQFQYEYVLFQIDNRIMGSYWYDNITTPRAVMRNDVISPYAKGIFSDVHKNYMLEASVRSNVTLSQIDYLAKFYFLKYRLDQDFTIMRRSRKYDVSQSLLRQNIMTLMQYGISYPFDERMRIGANMGYRKEYLTSKISDAGTLATPDKHLNYATGKVEFIYDNTNSKEFNIFNGFKLKAWYDFARDVKLSGSLHNLNLDIRYYQSLAKRIIWATKLTSAYPLGAKKVAYYLGAVENWTRVEQFDRNGQALVGPEFPFQQIVSNLRGFNRNVRVGSGFYLLNTELRFPIVNWLFRNPIENDFIRAFQFTVFADIGTAFTGTSPRDPNNPFNTIYISKPNYNLSVTAARNPYAMGFGFGARSKIFGYLIKFDRAWGLMESTIQKPMNYFSLGMDF